MPDGVPSRPSVPPDLLQLLKLMNLRSAVVEQRLAESEGGQATIEELPPAAPSVLDKMVEARVRVEEEALTAAAGGIEEPDDADAELAIDEAVPEAEPAPVEPAPVRGLAAALFSQPAAAPPKAREEPEPAEDADVDLLEMNAAEAGQPSELEGYQPPAVPEMETEADEGDAAVDEYVERDELLEPAERESAAPEAHAAGFQPDEPAPEEEETEAPTEVDPLADIEAIEADLAKMEADLQQYEQLTSDPAATKPAGPSASFGGSVEEGPGEDFQALLSGARSLAEGEEAPRNGEQEFPFLPADGDVKLRARNGPKPGAEFVGKSTLAGASGMFCLIHGFNLPLGTRMKVSLVAPDFVNQIQVDDAVVTRLRKAPDNATEVQLSFDAHHDELREFVSEHFDRAAFSLFGRRKQPKH